VKDFLLRMWEDLVGRQSGPMHVRFLLQPIAAAFFAIRAGARDAREGRPLYFRSIFRDPLHRREILREGWRDVGRVLVVAVVIDVVYQIAVLHRFSPLQAVVVAFLLALLPYLFFRGLTNRLKRVSGFWS